MANERANMRTLTARLLLTVMIFGAARAMPTAADKADLALHMEAPVDALTSETSHAGKSSDPTDDVPRLQAKLKLKELALEMKDVELKEKHVEDEYARLKAQLERAQKQSEKDVLSRSETAMNKKTTPSFGLNDKTVKAKQGGGQVSLDYTVQVQVPQSQASTVGRNLIETMRAVTPAMMQFAVVEALTQHEPSPSVTTHRVCSDDPNWAVINPWHFMDIFGNSMFGPLTFTCDSFQSSGCYLNQIWWMRYGQKEHCPVTCGTCQEGPTQYDVAALYASYARHTTHIPSVLPQPPAPSKRVSAATANNNNHDDSDIVGQAFTGAFLATGCCNTAPYVGYWASLGSPQSAFNDMFGYCEAVKTGQATPTQTAMCGCGVLRPTSCHLQSTYSIAFLASGCCNRAPYTGYWETLSTDAAHNDMFGYCEAVRTGVASASQIDMCGCGSSPPTSCRLIA
jgi:hypothetical protein